MSFTPEILALARESGSLPYVNWRTKKLAEAILTAHTESAPQGLTATISTGDSPPDASRQSESLGQGAPAVADPSRGTPLTDCRAVTFEMGFPILNVSEIVSADFARSLERQLAEAQSALKDERELHRMQLDAISILSLCNTPESSKKQRIGRDNPYWTVALQDVYAAVDREIALTAERDSLKAALTEFFDLWEYGQECYEDPDDAAGYMGHAVKLPYELEDRILALIPKERDAALAEREEGKR